MSKVAILGLGYLGQSLAQLFVREGREVVGTRTSSESLEGVEIFSLLLQEMDQESLKRCGFDRAKHWYCLLPPSCSPLYVEKLKLWCELAQLWQVESLVYTSSTSVFGGCQEGCYCEDSLTSPISDSANKIVEVERALKQAKVERKVVLRLGGLYCKDRHPLYSLQKRAEIREGKRRVNMTHRDLAVYALRQALELVSGEHLLHVVEPDHPTRKDFYTQEAERLATQAPNFVPQEGEPYGKQIGTNFLEQLRRWCKMSQYLPEENG